VAKESIEVMSLFDPGSLVVGMKSGKILRIDLTNGDEEQISEQKLGPVLALHRIRENGAARVLAVRATSAETIDVSTRVSTIRATYPPLIRADTPADIFGASVAFADPWVAVCGSECMLYHLPEFAEQGRIACGDALVIDPQAGIAFCPRLGSSAIYFLDGRDAFHAARPGLERDLEDMGAMVEVHKIPGCHRVVIDVASGNVDVVYPSERILYDVAEHRVVVRESEWARNEPIFCNMPDAIAYSNDLVGLLEGGP
jgi:hypothetical protein